MTASSARFSALLPILLFLALFLGSGIYYTLQGTEFAFYQLKAPVAALPAIVLAILLNKKTINESIERFLQGAAHPNIILMCMVFMLAGAFASVSKSIGSVDATVQFGLQLIPSSLVLPALFVISAFIATAMGTSMGTIAACAPIAVGFASATGMPTPLALGAILSGAMFGDNLSMISDTTIAATRSQGVSLRDKFRINIWIALPAAIISCLIFMQFSQGTHQPEVQPLSSWLIAPYLAVFALAFTGLHVLAILIIGIVLAGVMGLWLTPAYHLTSLNTAIYAGFVELFEIMLLSLFIGGLSQLMHDQGGMRWLVNAILSLTRKLKMSGKRAGEFGIALLTVTVNLFVANNTVAIIIAADVAKDLAIEQMVDLRRSASYLDIFSCVVQGLIPYGAQILLASAIGKVSPLALTGTTYYCWVLGIVAILSIILQYPRLKTTTLPHA
ncbi:Na+/H+ antiporter NhaC family protein [Alkanindiges sp. WGS2144]|uniref:Na+/H+ antiporter NhaC family protein n=1 Tax=Alkanindiges sp. WGS2144 TaxID=3366808 RepID=UPI003752EB00